MDEPSKEQLTLVTLLASVQVLNETLDDLKDTAFYKQAFKKEVNRFETALNRVCGELINKMWDLDEDTMVAMQIGIESVSKEMARMSPTRLAAIGELFKQSKITWPD